MRNTVCAIIVAIFALMTVGCAKPWNGFRTGIESVAALNVAANDALLVAQERVDGRVTDELVEEYQEALAEFVACQQRPNIECQDPGSVDEWMERWDERTEGVVQGIAAVEEINQWVILADREAQRWRDAGDVEVPTGIVTSCNSLEALLGRVLASLRALEQEYPSQLDTVQQYMGPVCGFAVTALGGSHE